MDFRQSIEITARRCLEAEGSYQQLTLRTYPWLQNVARHICFNKGFENCLKHKTGQPKIN